MDRRRFLKLSAATAAAVLSGATDLSSAQKTAATAFPVDLESDDLTFLYGTLQAGYRLPNPSDFKVGDLFCDSETGDVWVIKKLLISVTDKIKVDELRFVKVSQFNSDPVLLMAKNLPINVFEKDPTEND